VLFTETLPVKPALAVTVVVNVPLSRVVRLV
jgi:hypothetical protein